MEGEASGTTNLNDQLAAFKSAFAVALKNGQNLIKEAHKFYSDCDADPVVNSLLEAKLREWTGSLSKMDIPDDMAIKTWLQSTALAVPIPVPVEDSRVISDSHSVVVPVPVFTTPAPAATTTNFFGRLPRRPATSNPAQRILEPEKPTPVDQSDSSPFPVVYPIPVLATNVNGTPIATTALDYGTPQESGYASSSSASATEAGIADCGTVGTSVADLSSPTGDGVAITSRRSVESSEIFQQILEAKASNLSLKNSQKPGDVSKPQLKERTRRPPTGETCHNCLCSDHTSAYCPEKECSISRSDSLCSLSSGVSNKRVERELQTIAIASVGNDASACKLAWHLRVTWPTWARQRDGIPSAQNAPRHFCFVCPSTLTASQMDVLDPKTAAKCLLTHMLSEQHKQSVERRRTNLLQRVPAQVVLKYANERLGEKLLGWSLSLGHCPLPHLNDTDHVVSFRGKQLVDGCILRIWNQSDDEVLLRLEAAVSSTKGYRRWRLMDCKTNAVLFEPLAKGAGELKPPLEHVLQPNKAKTFCVDVLDLGDRPRNFNIALLFLVAKTSSQECLENAGIKTFLIDFIPRDFVNC